MRKLQPLHPFSSNEANFESTNKTIQWRNLTFGCYVAPKSEPHTSVHFVTLVTVSRWQGREGRWYKLVINGDKGGRGASGGQKPLFDGGIIFEQPYSNWWNGVKFMHVFFPIFIIYFELFWKMSAILPNI